MYNHVRFGRCGFCVIFILTISKVSLIMQLHNNKTVNISVISIIPTGNCAVLKTGKITTGTYGSRFKRVLVRAAIY